MRTNTKQITQAIQAHILEIVGDNTIDDVMKAFRSEALHEYNIRKLGTAQNIFVDWLMGLPGVIDILFTYHDIIEFLESIGLSQPENKTDSDSSDLYFRLVAREFLKMADK